MRFTVPDGNVVTQQFTGMTARAVQHEMITWMVSFGTSRRISIIGIWVSRNRSKYIVSKNKEPFMETFLLMSSKVVIPNWSRRIPSTVYAIIPTADGRFSVNVHLFLNEPTDPTKKMQKIILWWLFLWTLYKTPEKVMMYLYVLGPIFHHTSFKALEMDDGSKVVKVWSIIPPEQVLFSWENRVNSCTR
jgi:hypothetical protein